MAVAPYIAVKKARLARAGMQLYSAHDMKALRPTFKDTGKAIYREYRPAEVLVKNLSKFNGVPFVNGHAPVDVSPDNWKEYAIGFVGDSASVEVFDDEIWITNDIFFYDRGAYNEYQAGKKEVSAGYDAVYAQVKDSEKSGYDTVMLDIPVVNHVALCPTARAGHNARILDSSGYIFNEIGGTRMKGGFLSFLGIGKSKDENFKFSAVLMDSLGKVKTLDSAGCEKEVSGVMSHLTSFGDSEVKEVLVGAVADCFKNADAVLAEKDAVSKRVDELYGKCRDADNEAVRRILDSKKDSGSEGDKKCEKCGKEPCECKKDGDGKDNKGEAGKAKDAASVDIDTIVNTVVEKMSAKINDSVDAAVKKALCLDGSDGKKAADGRVQDSAGSDADNDASFLVRGVFGNR